MQLTPRYDGPRVLHIEAAVADPGNLVLQQRRRLAETLAGFDESQWRAPSRCEGWSTRDVVSHLVGTNRFWAASMSSGLAGSPTRILAAFDPVATPAAMVDASRAMAPIDVLAAYCASLDQLAAVLTDVPADAWSRPAESPVGHVELRAVALHALWDAWTHERDILLPLGLDPTADDDEIRASLIYAAAISPTLLATQGSTRTGRLAVDGTTPDVSLVVDVGPTVTVRDRGSADPADAELRGAAVDVIESLTLRVPVRHDVDPEFEWMLGGLAEAFDRA